MMKCQYSLLCSSKYKHLPHFRELLGNLSPFVFSEEDANLVFNKLLEKLTERKEGKIGGKSPHIIVIVLNEYGFKSHLISEYLPVYEEDKDTKDEISFVFCKRYQEELPKYCEYIIKRSEKKSVGNWYLFPHTQMVSYSNENENNYLDEKKYCFYLDAYPDPDERIGNEKSYDRYFRA